MGGKNKYIQFSTANSRDRNSRTQKVTDYGQWARMCIKKKRYIDKDVAQKVADRWTAKGYPTRVYNEPCPYCQCYHLSTKI